MSWSYLREIRYKRLARVGSNLPASAKRVMLELLKSMLRSFPCSILVGSLVAWGSRRLSTEERDGMCVQVANSMYATSEAELLFSISPINQTNHGWMYSG